MKHSVTDFSKESALYSLWCNVLKTLHKYSCKNSSTWYGHVQRIAEGRLSKIALKWMPKQKRARGRPKKNWMEGIRKTMNERNLNEGQWEDIKQWSLGVEQRKTTFCNRYIHTRLVLPMLGILFHLILILTEQAIEALKSSKHNNSLPDKKECWKSKDSFFLFLLFEELKQRVYQIANCMRHP